MNEKPELIETVQAVTVTYTNYRGETAKRQIVPHRIYWGCNPWHPEKQWLLECYDMEKKAHRTFAMSGIVNWRQPGL